MTRRLLTLVALAAVLVSSCARVAPTRPPAAPAAGGITAHAVRTGLNNPAAFTIAPNGRIFFGERLTGNIRILNPVTGNTPLFFHVPNVATNGEQGLLGIALHPNFSTSPYVYVYATRSLSGNLRNQIIRITDSGGTGKGMKVIFTSSTTAGDYHDGGRILFGHDGMLYAVVGEAHNSSNAQKLSVAGGKILRMTPTGGIPSTNPFHSRVWAYGIRNSYGFAFDPRTGRLWETENGPECDDELNRIVKGRNLGWGPHETCSTPPAHPRDTNQDGPNPLLPKRWYTPTIAPTGIAFCRQCGLGTTNNGKLFFGTYNTDNIRRVRLTSNRLGVAAQAIVYSHSSSILSMEVGPNHALYFSDATGIYKLVHT